MSDKLGRRDLFRLWRPADRTADRESKTPAGTRQEAPDSTPAGGFSLDGFYAGRATQTSATLPAFEVTVPRGPGAAAANIATTSRGTPELADRPLYVAGADVLGGRYRIYDLADPVNPQLVTTSPGAPGASTPYMHDSTSLRLTDNPTTQCAAAHNPCEVLVDFDVERVELWDVTDKATPAFLGAATYPNARYIHSGWPTADQQYVIVHDELDELRIPGLNTSIYTLDLTDLRARSIMTSFTGADSTTDHNGYTVGDRYYLAHYRRGLVIHDLATPRALREVAWFDTYLLPEANIAGTEGVWGVYPFLPSGTIAVSDISNGLFLLKRNETSATPPPPPAPPPVQVPSDFNLKT